ncbi:hypothetical protein MSG28_002268 [Choristoneura fumiferana]|uniref:Uncharacterized protein n=1 Tax=Choristoneura fumiferana TaxID=7141 RepID=A0ACC0JVK6_CHOFU|nr:hypothetical protein MSG28_002268 [Choristoneura fumiferana]
MNYPKQHFDKPFVLKHFGSLISVVGPCAWSARIATTILLANPAVKQQSLHCCVSVCRIYVINSKIKIMCNDNVQSYVLINMQEAVMILMVSLQHLKSSLDFLKIQSSDPDLMLMGSNKKTFIDERKKKIQTAVWCVTAHGPTGNQYPPRRVAPCSYKTLALNIEERKKERKKHLFVTNIRTMDKKNKEKYD